MPHYTIAVFDGEEMTDENIGRVVKLLASNGVKTIYNIEGENVDIVDVKAYLHLVEPNNEENKES